MTAKGDVVSLRYRLLTLGGEISWHLDGQPRIITIRKMWESTHVELIQNDARYKLRFSGTEAGLFPGLSPPEPDWMSWADDIARHGRSRRRRALVWACPTYLTFAGRSQWLAIVELLFEDQCIVWATLTDCPVANVPVSLTLWRPCCQSMAGFCQSIWDNTQQQQFLN